VSGRNRSDEDERILINEQLRDHADAAAEREQFRQREEAEREQRRQQQEEAERRSLEQRRQQEAKLEGLYHDLAAKTPAQLHAWLRQFLTREVDDGSAPDEARSFFGDLQRLRFLEALAINEDDVTTRLVFADWLDERGEHEEADRQRKWPAAKEWLARLCLENSGDEGVSYDGVLAFGRHAVKEESASGRVSMTRNEALWSALRADSQEFWRNWSVVTGVPLPPSFEHKGFHSWACCSNEVYYWFGLPPLDDPDE
jgi:uncharacterized protein (TIGR02996 family)